MLLHPHGGKQPWLLLNLHGHGQIMRRCHRAFSSPPHNSTVVSPPNRSNDDMDDENRNSNKDDDNDDDENQEVMDDWTLSSDSLTEIAMDDQKKEEDERSVLSAATRAAAEAVRPRNAALGEMIKDGIHDLNQSAFKIQGESKTKRSLFVKEQDPELFVQQETQKAFLLKVAQTALTDVSRTKGMLMCGGETIVILDAKTHKGDSGKQRVAVLYWSLPVSILISKEYSKYDKQYLEYRMHKHITQQGGLRALQQRMTALFSHVYGYPPSVRLEPAPDELIIEMIESVTQNIRLTEDDDDDDDDDDFKHNNNSNDINTATGMWDDEKEGDKMVSPLLKMERLYQETFGVLEDVDSKKDKRKHR